MSRPQKPIAEHLKDGTYRADRHANRGIQLNVLDSIEVPTTLNECAKAKWNEVVPQLLEKSLIALVDLPELTSAFVHYGTAQDCLNYVNKNYSNHAEYLSQLNLCRGTVNLLSEYTKKMEVYNRIMHKFGATPVERAKIKIEPKKEDEDDNFMQQLMITGA